MQLKLNGLVFFFLLIITSCSEKFSIKLDSNDSTQKELPTFPQALTPASMINKLNFYFKENEKKLIKVDIKSFKNYLKLRDKELNDLADAFININPKHHLEFLSDLLNISDFKLSDNKDSSHKAFIALLAKHQGNSFTRDYFVTVVLAKSEALKYLGNYLSQSSTSFTENPLYSNGTKKRIISSYLFLEKYFKNSDTYLNLLSKTLINISLNQKDDLFGLKNYFQRLIFIWTQRNSTDLSLKQLQSSLIVGKEFLSKDLTTKNKIVFVNKINQLLKLTSHNNWAKCSTTCFHLLDNYQNFFLSFLKELKKEQDFSFLNKTFITTLRPLTKMYLARALMSFNKVFYQTRKDFFNFPPAAFLNIDDINSNKYYKNTLFTVDYYRFKMEELVQFPFSDKEEQENQIRSLHKHLQTNLISTLNYRFSRHYSFGKGSSIKNLIPLKDLNFEFNEDDKSIRINLCSWGLKSGKCGEKTIPPGIYSVEYDLELTGDIISFHPLAMIYSPGKKVLIQANEIKSAWINVSGSAVEKVNEYNYSDYLSFLLPTQGSNSNQKWIEWHGQDPQILLTPKKQANGLDGNKAGLISISSGKFSGYMPLLVAMGGEGGQGVDGIDSVLVSKRHLVKDNESLDFLKFEVGKKHTWHEKKVVCQKHPRCTQF